MGDGKGVEGAPLLMLPARVRALLPTFYWNVIDGQRGRARVKDSQRRKDERTKLCAECTWRREDTTCLICTVHIHCAVICALMS
jgi:hypothetical protein